MRFLRSAAALLALAAGTAGGYEPADVLELLHDGRFDAADRLVLTAGRDAPEASFFRAFVTYWRLLYDEDNEGLREELADRLKDTIDRSREAERAGRDAALWQGSAHLLRAQLRGMEKKVFAAGFDAKKANRLLRLAVERGSRQADSDFGLGTYEYFAHRLPAVVRALRTILTIPGGNRDRGLERLERAADRSRYFSTEARIVLTTIYLDEEERLYEKARTQLDRALREDPDTVVVLHTAGRLELDFHRPTRALSYLRRALDVVAATDGVHPSVETTLRFLAAEAELQRFRPDRAGIELAAIRGAVPVSLEGKVGRLRELLAGLAAAGDEPRTPEERDLRRTGRSLARALPALERERRQGPAAAIGALGELAEQDPDDPVFRLLLSRARLLGEHEDGFAGLEEDLPLPAYWGGTLELLRGLSADVGGRRDDALDRYRTAERLRFPGRNAATLCLTRRCTAQDLDSRLVPDPAGDKPAG